MERILEKEIDNVVWVLFGAVLIMLCAWIKIPFYPVPFTLQTLAIYGLALAMPPRLACASASCYLLLAMASHANPLWIMGKCGGYVISFPIAAYLISHLRQTRSRFLALSCGMGVIFGLGFLWLIPFCGWKAALIKGVLLFIPSEIFKLLAAMRVKR